jgi:hypothetical protein
MDWVDLDSGHLQSAAYDEESETLYVQFRNGRRYGFEGVPEGLASRLFSETESHGKYFRRYILKNFQGQEITE